MSAPLQYARRPDPFYDALKARVHAHFREQGLSPLATPYFFAKGALLLTVYGLGYALVLWQPLGVVSLLGGYILMGALSILLGLNLAHDAAHGAISKRAWVNRLFLHVFDLLGANSYAWRNRHIFAHHHYPNVLDHDSDIQQVPFVRIFPNDRLRKVHRWQHVYMPPVYFFYTLHWILRRDFVDFMADRIGAFRPRKQQQREWLKLLGFKALYFGYVVGLPLWLYPGQWGWVLLGFLLMNFAGSAVVAIALVSTHVGENAVFPQPDEAGRLDHTWAEHQILTTADFCTDHPVVNFLFGGFNHHVVHHLFPRISHVHYPQLTPIVKATAEEFGLSYHCEPTLRRTLLSHWALLHKQGPQAWANIDH